MSRPQIKFYPCHIERIMSGDKKTTIRKKTTLQSGDNIELIDTDGNHVAFATISRIYYGFTLNKDGACTSGYTLERLIFILKSEGMTWKELASFIQIHYELPFLGCVIEFELEICDE